MKRIFIILVLLLTITACGQNANGKQNIQQMDTSKLTNETVKGAIEALQEKDKEKWLTYFTADAKMTDDGNPRDFQSFSKNAVGDEWFTELHRVENNGKDIFGHLVTKQWGEFDVYFKFHVNAENKIHQLDIGQVSKQK